MSVLTRWRGVETERQPGGWPLLLSFLSLFPHHLPGKEGSMKEGLKELSQRWELSIWILKKWGASGGMGEERLGGIFTLQRRQCQSQHWPPFSNRESQNPRGFGLWYEQGWGARQTRTLRPGVWTGTLNLLPDGCMTWAQCVAFLACTSSNHTSKGQV